MKKIIFLLVAVLGIAAPMSMVASPSEMNVTETMVVCDDYEFVGEYSFCSLKQCYSWYAKVYIKGGVFYVMKNNVKYRLMPCSEGEYNYYFSFQGDKYYVKL